MSRENTVTYYRIINETVKERLGIPIIHIADATADALLNADIKTAALLGTKYTMLREFYKERLEKRGITVLIPNGDDIETVNRVIYDELCRGAVLPTSQKEYVRIIGALKQRGAQCVILGCTEIGMLVNEECSPLPVFDTTVIHAEKAAYLSIKDQ